MDRVVENGAWAKELITLGSQKTPQEGDTHVWSWEMRSQQLEGSDGFLDREASVQEDDKKNMKVGRGVGGVHVSREWQCFLRWGK